MRSPSRAEALSDIFARRLSDVHTSMPGHIVRWDSTTGKADVQPDLKFSYFNELDEKITEALPVCVNVPIVFPGSGGMRVTFPVKVNDPVWLQFAEGSIDRQLSEGGTVDPGDPRRFSLSDAVAFVGYKTFATPLASCPTDRATFGQDRADTRGQIHIREDGSILIGSNVGAEVEPAALGDALVTWLASHTHPASSGTTSPSTLPTTGIKSTTVSVRK